ncbi:hypothetical protein LINGRAHAP2_LOCUS18564 [Linum grandiflorum]
MSSSGDPNSSDGNAPSQAQEEQILKSKYGGILPKKKPLISKDHERAFFDSADWALGKGAQKPKGPLEALRPKLQPTRQQASRSRRSAYAPGNEDEVDGTGEAASDSVEGGGAEEQSNHGQP